MLVDKLKNPIHKGFSQN